MYLKKITSSGFKSFADRITLNLEKQNITGIVGPNGSGKSNVIDAVRWVMGEQNAKMLRGETATDIIFSGSERRKPQNMAEVTLVFDNSTASSFCPPEYRLEPEISLTRRIYRDGQREYFINRKPCRLKDIVSFFTSTGLGGRSYSMIQQGQVDRILQAKPEQIREILEEAAGTLIFKKRRQETLKKLEATQVNMSRVQDILIEVDRQLEALSEQVNKAKRWKEASDDLKRSELSLFAHTYSHHHQKTLELAGKIEEESLREAAVIEHLADYEVRHRQLQEELEDADPEVAELNESIAVLREKLASREASLLSVIKLNENGGQQLVTLETELKKDDESLSALRKQVSEAKHQIDHFSDDEQRLRDTAEELTHRLETHDEEHAVHQRHINDLTQEVINLDKQHTATEMRIESLEREVGQAQRELKEKTAHMEGIDEDDSQQRIMVESAQVKANSAQRHLDELLRQKASIEADRKDAEDKISTDKTRHDHVKQQQLETSAHLSSLQELQASASDCKSVALSLRQHPELNHNLRSLSDLVHFQHGIEELPKPLVQGLENWFDRLIFSDFEHFQKAAKIAVEESLAPVPASIIGKSKLSDQTKLKIKELGLRPVEPLLQIHKAELNPSHILDTLFIPGEGADSQSLLPKIPEGVTVFFADGSVASGQQEHFLGITQGQGALSRKRKIEQLSEQEASLLKRVQDINHRLNRHTEQLEVVKKKQSQVDLELLEQNKKVISSLSELQEIKHQVETKREKLAGWRQDYEKYSKVYNEGQNKLDELKAKLNQLVEQKTNTERALEDARFEIEDVVAERDEQKRQLEQIRFDLNTREDRARSLKETYQFGKSQLDVLQDKFHRQKNEYENLKTNIEKATSERAQLEKEIETYVYQREEYEIELAKRKDANSALVDQIRNLEKKINEGRNLIQRSQKAKNDFEMEKERLKIAKETIKEQALEKYHLQIAEYKFEPDPEFKSDKVNRHIHKLRNELDQMGPINMIAIDEYEELTERNQFILGQREEIQSSIDLLETAIEEIEENSEAKFLDTFHTLNKEFSNLFPILFPRGEAQIQLTDDAKPLEAGVEIMVRLPGKNRQNMRLFSGGEKALTAIALIFALLKSKPTPFCFLDEVDAPLDETNVSRYNHILEALADRFQFICITHRRKTMEVLDTLYGVTMQEPGVSKVVGVDMAKALPDHLKKAFKEEKKIQGATAQL